MEANSSDMKGSAVTVHWKRLHPPPSLDSTSYWAYFPLKFNLSLNLSLDHYQKSHYFLTSSVNVIHSTIHVRSGFSSFLWTFWVELFFACSVVSTQMSLEDFTMYGGAFGNKQDSVFPNLEVRWRHWLNHKLFIMLIKFKVPVCSKRHRATDSDWMKFVTDGCFVSHRGLWCPRHPLSCCLPCPGLPPMPWLASCRTN